MLIQLKQLKFVSIAAKPSDDFSVLKNAKEITVKLRLSN